jgi:hypothetical protein
MLRKMSDNLDLLIDVPPETNRHRDKIFIIDYQYCEVYLDEIVEEFTYVMDDENLWNHENWPDNDALSRRFVGNINKMFTAVADYAVIQYTGDVIREMGKVAEEIKQRGVVWYFAAFYHNDQETLELFRQTEMPADVLKEKALWLDAFSQHPFIKPVEVPRAKVLDFRYLDSLFGIKRE